MLDAGLTGVGSGLPPAVRASLLPRKRAVFSVGGAPPEVAGCSFRVAGWPPHEMGAGFSVSGPPPLAMGRPPWAAGWPPFRRWTLPDGAGSPPFGGRASLWSAGEPPFRGGTLPGRGGSPPFAGGASLRRPADTPRGGGKRLESAARLLPSAWAVVRRAATAPFSPTLLPRPNPETPRFPIPASGSSGEVPRRARRRRCRRRRCPRAVLRWRCSRRPILPGAL